MWRRMVSRLTVVNDGYGKFMERISNPSTHKDFLYGFLIFGGAWALAWNAHLIGPWVDQLMGWGPHDIDSEGKIRWRRMWSTAICLPALLVGSALYIRKLLRDRHRKE